MSDMMTQVNQIVGNGLSFLQSTVILAVTICIGLIIGLFGLKLARVWAALVGLVLGVAAGGIVSVVAGLDGMASVGAMAGGAVILAILVCVFYRVGIFFFVWLAIFSMGVSAINQQVIPVIAVCGVLGLILAIVTMKMFDPLVIIITSIYGGYMAGNAAVSMFGLGNYLAAVIGVPVVLIAICVAVQFIMRSRQVGRKQVKKAGEHREKESREAEVEQARMLLDDDNMDDTEVTDLEDDDDLETDCDDDTLDSEDSLDGDYDEDDGYLDDDLESGYDNLDFDDDFKIIE